MTQTPTQPDLKPRSREVTDGLERAAPAGCCARSGMRDEDFTKPQIGIASSWNEITPCNLSLQRLAQAARRRARGRRLPHGVRDDLGLRRHLDGPRGDALLAGQREIIADSVETVMQAERLDGTVLLAGCDKCLPGMLMAAARLDLAAVFVYAGSILPGHVTATEVTIATRSRPSAPCCAG
jgi:dihydroxy-acid dehydratase